MGKLWFTADTHFGHYNIIKYCDRPFDTTLLMDNTIKNNWNTIVEPEDTVYHLGDISTNKAFHSIISELNGEKFLIRGNHDPYRDVEGFEWIKDYHELKVEDQLIVLCHYPMTSWNGSSRGSWMLHGHCHGKFEANTLKRWDVGIDCWNLKPVSFEQLKESSSSKEDTSV